MNIIIREYKDSDYAACRSLYGELAQHHAEIYSDSSIAGNDPGRGFDTYLERPDRLVSFVAEVDGNVIGLTGLLRTIGEEEGGVIEPVVTSVNFRNKGIGSKLIQYVIPEAKKRNIRWLGIRPVARNEEAFILYARLGFNLVGNIDLFQDLSPDERTTWKSGLVIHGQKLKY